MLVVLLHVDVLTLQTCESWTIDLITETLSSVTRKSSYVNGNLPWWWICIPGDDCQHSYAGSFILTLLQHLAFTGITKGPVEGWVRQALQVC